MSNILVTCCQIHNKGKKTNCWQRRRIRLTFIMHCMLWRVLYCKLNNKPFPLHVHRHCSQETPVFIPSPRTNNSSIGNLSDTQMATRGRHSHRLLGKISLLATNNLHDLFRPAIWTNQARDIICLGNTNHNSTNSQTNEKGVYLGHFKPTGTSTKKILVLPTHFSIQ
jgi:hypothetical protein